jgi:hypothetical protein
MLLLKYSVSEGIEVTQSQTGILGEAFFFKIGNYLILLLLNFTLPLMM